METDEQTGDAAKATVSTSAKKGGEVKRMREIFAEDPDWSLEVVPKLSNLCLRSIVKHFEGYPIFEQLTESQKAFVEESLSTSLPLHVTAPVIRDGVYWRRCCQQRWDICDVSDYGDNWKRMYFERHLENIIELFVPDLTDPKTILDILPFCKSFINRLDIAQLLPNLKEAQEEEEELEEDSEFGNDDDPPLVHHFDFSILLHKLSCLEELHLVYRVEECGMNYERSMFEMTDRDCECLAKALRSCKSLKVLHLHNSDIDDEKCRMLVRFLLNHPSLKELDFSHNLIGDSGAQAMGKLVTESKLETLVLSDNDIHGLGGEAIAQALPGNTTLISLNLRLNRLRDHGGQAIGEALLENATLQNLHLGANEVTTPTALALAAVLAENKTLRNVNLSCNNLGVDGGKALEEAMSQNSSITEFDIRLTEVDEESTSLIKQMVSYNQSLLKKKRVVVRAEE